MKVANKFYVAAPNVCNGSRSWAKPTLEEAIAHAKDLVEAQGETQYVVKIVRVVRKKPMPIIVEAAE